jgi:hypothetical protein
MKSTDKKICTFFIKSLHISIFRDTFVSSIIKTNKDMDKKKFIVSVGSSYLLELIITEDIAISCYHCGDCEKDVMNGIKIPLIKEQLEKFETIQLFNVVSEIIGDEEKCTKMSREDLESWILFEASALFIDGDFNEYDE